MDSGGWVSIFNLGDYDIYDETDYFAVYEDSKHVASFKEKQEAVNYVLWKNANGKD